MVNLNTIHGTFLFLFFFHILKAALGSFTFETFSLKNQTLWVRKVANIF